MGEMQERDCPNCSHGFFSRGGEIKCPRCDGSGEVRVSNFPPEDQLCSQCQGTGWITCNRCGGTSRIYVESSYTSYQEEETLQLAKTDIDNQSRTNVAFAIYLAVFGALMVVAMALLEFLKQALASIF